MVGGDCAFECLLFKLDFYVEFMTVQKIVAWLSNFPTDGAKP